jgi:putative phosphoribosyl transferase
MHNQNGKNCCDNNKAHKPFFWAGYATRIYAHSIPSTSTIEAVTDFELRELRRREQLYRGSRSAPAIRDRTVILVDDGLATGATMRVAAAAVKRQEPKRLIVAVPVAASEACTELKGEVDEVICAEMPETFSPVCSWYEDFSKVTDGDVRELLAKADQNDVAKIR